LIKLMDTFLKIIDFDFHNLFFFLKLFLNLKYFDINHFVFLNLRDKLLLSQCQIIINLLKLLFDLLDLLIILSRKEATTSEISSCLLSVRFCLSFVFKFLESLNSLS
jgi:hypothetical protein